MFLRLTANELSQLASFGLVVSAEDPVHNSNKVWSIPIDSCVRCSQLIEKLHASSVIRQLEEQLDFTSYMYGSARSELISQIIALSVKYSIMNSQTSFLVVSDMQSVSLAAEDVVIPHHYNASSAYAASAGGFAVSARRDECEDCNEEEVDALEGGMDMFGGGSSGRWETSFVGPTLDLAVIMNEVGADVHVKFIKLHTHGALIQFTADLTRYVQTKFGLNEFAVQFSAVESVYRRKFVTTQRNYVSCGGGCIPLRPIRTYED
eukprot:gene27656-34406_t